MQIQLLIKKIDALTITPQQLIDDVVHNTQVATIDDSELEAIIQKVLSENQKAVTDYKSGKESVIMFLLGQVMRALGKKVDAQSVKNALIKSLN